MQKLSKAVKLNQQMHLDKNHLCSIKGIVFFTAYLRMTIPEYTKNQLLKKQRAIPSVKASYNIRCEEWISSTWGFRENT